jgi:hypothetical protein
MSQFSSLSEEFYNMSTPVTRKVGMTQAVADNEATTMLEPQAAPAEEPLGFGGYAQDIGLGVVRGVVGAAADVADLAVMPFSDYDVPDYFGVMDPAKTMAGGVTEGIANFLTGFIPGIGIAGKIGKIGKIGQLTKSVDTAIDVARASGYAKKAIALKGAQAFVKGSVAGAIADFGAFDGHEARLSNLLREHAGWTDPFTAYLAADENDSEIEGRLKNAIEGTIIGGLTEGVFNAFRMYKAGYFAKSTGLDPNAAMATEAIKIRGEQRNLIKTSFNLTDEQAEATNILIDRMGLDRSKITIQSGEAARETYNAAALAENAGKLLRQEVELSDDPLWIPPVQEFTSAKTSINATKPSKGFTIIGEGWQPGTTNLDIGGGRFEAGSKVLADRGVTNVIYDPFNRSVEQNMAAVASTARGQADTVTVFNVMNVIKEEGNRLQVLRQADDALKPGGKLYIQVYEGDKSGISKVTGSDQFQLNKKTADYLEEVRKVFPDAELKKGLIIAPKRAPDLLRQTAETEVRGFASFAEDGKSIIGGLSNPNVSTAVEEITHVARRQLFDKSIPPTSRFGIQDADIDVAARWSGATEVDGKWNWSVDAEERFAAGFNTYLREGTAPAGLEGMFSKLADWLTGLYREIKGSPIDVPVSKEMEDVFAKLIDRGPGFDAVGGVTAAGAPILRSTTPSPGSVGLGKPPEKELNIERFSTIDEVNRGIDDMIGREPLASSLPEASRTIEETARRAQPVADELRAIVGMEGMDLQRMLNSGTTSRWQIEKATRELVGLRKFAANAGNRLVNLSKKGRAASSDEMYEFLVGERSLTIVLQTIKERGREIARGLGAMRYVPDPDRTFTFLPPMPKPGEAVSPGAMVPPPAAAAPSPAALPLGTPKDPAMAPDAVPTSAAPGALPKAPEAIGEAVSDAIPLPSLSTAGLSPEAIAAIQKRAIEQAGGEDAIRAAMERYLAAAAGGGDEAVLRMARGQQKWMGALVEFWMNNILSGPVTHAVNNSANLLTTLYLPFERILGSTLRGDFKTASVTMRRYMYLLQQASDSVKMAGVAMKMDTNILDSVSTRETGNARALSATGLGINEDTVFGQAANWVGKALNLPTRFLTAEDEFFKQLNYRASFMSELHVEGLRRFAGDSAQAAKWANETFNRSIQDGQMYARDVILKRAYTAADDAISNGTLAATERGTFVAKYMNNQKNWDSKLGVMSERALDSARQTTFSTPLSTDPTAPLTTRLAARMQAAANEHPVIRFLLPFIRTPTNLLNFTLSRTLPVSGMHDLRLAYKEYGALLNHTDASIRADAAGRLAFSFALTTTVYMAASGGKITGGGPKNKGERDTLIQAGWQPYSIKVGDKYYSYKREDPFSSMLGLVADLTEGYKYAEARHMDSLGGATNAVVLALARNITNKTYLTGITNVTNALSNPEQFGPTLVNQYVSSLVPFSSALDQSKSTVADDAVLRDARNMVDAIYSKIPFLAEQVNPQRNVLGEAMTKPAGLGPDMFSPVTYTQVTDDVILAEFGLLGHGFTPPKPNKGAVDLTQFKTSSGQEAYDRWLELHGTVSIKGQTLRQALVKTIKSRDYQKLSPDTTDDYDSPRVRVIRGIISKYRASAYERLLKESPDLKQADRLDFANKQALRMGRSAQELFDLVNR